MPHDRHLSYLERENGLSVLGCLVKLYELVFVSSLDCYTAPMPKKIDIHWRCSMCFMCKIMDMLPTPLALAPEVGLPVH